jgi:hypothetical protein
VDIVASTCSVTWYPGSWWADNLSSTRMGACSAAKHYTLSSCGGSYQIADLPYPYYTNLNAALNDNVHCLKYS